MKILVRPETPLTDSIARLFPEEDKIKIFFPEKRDSFIRLMHRYRYKWENPYWVRRVAAEEMGDRCAEIAYEILRAGFWTKGSKTIMQCAVDRRYATEPRRWICAYDGTGAEYVGWVQIAWMRDEDLYKDSLRISGARYIGGPVVVPPEHYDEVLDFCAENECHIFDSALDIIEDMRAERESAWVFTAVEGPADPDEEDFSEREFEIDEDLLDDD